MNGKQLDSLTRQYVIIFLEVQRADTHIFCYHLVDPQPSFPHLSSANFLEPPSIDWHVDEVEVGLRKTVETNGEILASFAVAAIDAAAGSIFRRLWRKSRAIVIR